MQLIIVDFVLRKTFNANQSPENITNTISEFLVEDMSLDRACELSRVGSLDLLELVWTRGLRSGDCGYWSVGKMVHSDPHYRLREFNRAMVQALDRNERPMVKWLLKHFQGCAIYQQVKDTVVKGRYSWFFKLIKGESTRPKFQWRNLDISIAAQHGHWGLVHRISKHRHGVRKLQHVVPYAFQQNNTKQLKWAVKKGFSINIFQFPEYSETVWQNCKDNIRYLLDVNRDGRTERKIAMTALKYGAEVGDSDFVDWLASRTDWTCGMELESSLGIGSKHGYIGVVRCLLVHMKRRNLFNGPRDAMFVAAENGRLELVQWLYEHYGRDSNECLFRKGELQLSCAGFFYTVTEMDVAARCGHLDVLKFLHRINLSSRKKRKRNDGSNDTQDASNAGNNQHPMCSIRTMDGAAEYGHLDVVKWLHSNRTEGCTSDAMNCAAANGHLEVIIWLHANSTTECTTVAMDQAALNGHLDVLKWLHANRLEGCTTTAMNMAATKGHLEVLQWLHTNTPAGCTTHAMDGAAAAGHLHVVKWLHDNRLDGECTSAAMETAAHNGHLAVVKFLNENRSEGDPASAIKAAAEGSDSAVAREQLRVVQYLCRDATRIRVAPAMTEALYSNNFEAVLLLHTQRPNFTYDELKEITRRLEDLSCHVPTRREICIWFKRNYLSRVDPLVE